MVLAPTLISGAHVRCIEPKLFESKMVMKVLLKHTQPEVRISVRCTKIGSLLVNYFTALLPYSYSNLNSFFSQ